MRKWLWLVLVSSLLCACKTIPTDEPGMSQQYSNQDRRSFETIAMDKEIEQRAVEEFYDDSELLSQSHVNINAYNGLALVTGEVMNEAVKNRVLDIVRFIPHVKIVRDSLTLAPPSDANSRMNDGQLTEQVKAALTQIYTLPDFNSSMVKVVTENSVVYLMGRVSREEGNVVIKVTRLQPNVQQIVTVFEYLD